MMNDRIKELAEQAGIAVWGDAVYMYDPKDTLDSTVMAKFAELIMQECINTLEFHGFDDAIPYMQWLATNFTGVRNGN